MMKALLLAALGLAGAAIPLPPEQVLPPKTARLVMPGGAITVDVVDTPAAREKGLMFRKSLKPDYGMLFVFPMELDLGFWMKNTYVPLDIVFIGADKKVTVVHRNVRASTEKTTDEEVARAGGRGQYVLELPAGAAKRWKLREGAKLRFEVVVPER